MASPLVSRPPNAGSPRARALLLASMAAELNERVALDDVLGTALSRAVELLRGTDGSLWLDADQGPPGWTGSAPARRS